ncbi:MAG: AAA family ATPase [Myxococcales bacterium]|nr:AAA family ATPase [Myxococcales bacterium]
MSDARLISLEVERFKSYLEPTRVELAPLTVLVGRNNSGKSTLIQALLLLKQTLAHRRKDIPLFLEGAVDALSLRELTYGWPENGALFKGPKITVRWKSTVDVQAALKRAYMLGQDYSIDHSEEREWLKNTTVVELETNLSIETTDVGGHLALSAVQISSHRNGAKHPISLDASCTEGKWTYCWKGEQINEIQVEFDHFLPYLAVDDQHVWLRSRERSWHVEFLAVFEQPLEDLKDILESLQYLGSTRTAPPSVYRSTGVPPEEIGMNGEYAAELIHTRRTDVVHYMPPLRVSDDALDYEDRIESRTFVEAVNDTLSHLGIEAELRLEDVPNIGFRLLFGKASLTHVGRGLTYLLPIVELGLFADPLRFKHVENIDSREAYSRACARYTHIAFEEPEAHIHPKVQTRLAHWMVAMAMANRQLIVETHSDHLVRRLRGLIARAQPGSELESWLRENVVIIEVEQHDGRSTIRKSRLTPDGSLGEHWPSDFMDEANTEESAIYYASLDKPAPTSEPVIESTIEHDVGDEPELPEEP